MTRKQLMLAAVAVGLALPGSGALAGSKSEAVQARAMLQRAVKAVTKNEHAALLAFTKRQDGFGEGDLYTFCARARSGWVVAHPFRLGDNLAEQSDVNGKLFGKEMLNTAETGVVKDIHYMWPRPGQRTPVQKDTFYTKVDDLVCGVGYYP